MADDNGSEVEEFLQVETKLMDCRHTDRIEAIRGFVK